MTTRIAIIDENKCKPTKCKHECKRRCPVEAIGKKVIEIDKIASISEELCSGCNICTKQCPFGAIDIINIPNGLQKDIVHTFGKNSFRLHRLPVPIRGKILGLIGQNGIGKSTALTILSKKTIPNFGDTTTNLTWNDVSKKYRGSELQLLFKNKMSVSFKPQYVDTIAANYGESTVGEILKMNDERHVLDTLAEEFELTQLFTHKLGELSGGELQRFALCLSIIKDCEMYIFDEPSSYLDIHQRIKMCKIIRELQSLNKYIIIVEHDLSVLDYLCDYVCIFYGNPSKYGVCTTPFTNREGINIFLSGYIHNEKLRFREYNLNFKLREGIEEEELKKNNYTYSECNLQYDKFKLKVNSGTFSSSQITVMLAKNGCGKTTFMKYLAGILENTNNDKYLNLSISYKPQKISPKFNGTVIELLSDKLGNYLFDPIFHSEVVKPLCIENIYENKVKSLSGGELQRLALAVSLGKQADLYLIDEPSAYLDSEQRIIIAKMIRRFVLHQKKSAFIIEHDFLMSTYLADQVIVFDGIPSKDCVANSPTDLYTGMNIFLKELNITLRRDPTNHRPRINKLNSQQDQEQRKNGTFFFLETVDCVDSKDVYIETVKDIEDL